MKDKGPFVTPDDESLIFGDTELLEEHLICDINRFLAGAFFQRLTISKKPLLPFLREFFGQRFECGFFCTSQLINAVSDRFVIENRTLAMQYPIMNDDVFACPGKYFSA